MEHMTAPQAAYRVMPAQADSRLAVGINLGKRPLDSFAWYECTREDLAKDISECRRQDRAVHATSGMPMAPTYRDGHNYGRSI